MKILHMVTCLLVWVGALNWGLYRSDYIEDDSGSAIEATRWSSILRDANTATTTGAEASIYVRRDGSDNGMIDSFTTYADGADKWLCGNANKIGDGYDCFGFIIGNSNTAKLMFNGSTKYSWNFSGTTLSNQASSGTDLKFVTLGSSNTISFDQGNNGGDLVIDSTGDVGIGITPTSFKLDVWSTASYAAARFVNSTALDTTNDVIGLYRYRSDSTPPQAGFGGDISFVLEGFTSSSTPTVARIGSAWENDQTNDTTDRDSNLLFSTLLDNSITERLRITSDGSIGIGETSPTATLHINKDTSTSSDVLLRAVSDVGSTNNTVFRVNADGNVYAEQAFNGSGADVAEYYDSLDGKGTDLDEGTVVSVDHKTYVKKSDGISDSKVIGVVSTKPGVVLGYNETGNDTRVRIALVGRVPVKVSTENGKIEVGDELSASSKEGVAMKASSDSKVIIGRALESYNGTPDGDKKILVLINTHVK